MESFGLMDGRYTYYSKKPFIYIVILLGTILTISIGTVVLNSIFIYAPIIKYHDKVGNFVKAGNLTFIKVQKAISQINQTIVDIESFIAHSNEEMNKFSNDIKIISYDIEQFINESSTFIQKMDVIICKYLPEDCPKD